MDGSFSDESTLAEPVPAGPGGSELDHASLTRSLWTVSLLFFLMYMAIGLYFTFFAVFMRERGLSGSQIGFVNMAAGIVSFFSAPFWGYMSDRTGKPKWLLASAAVGTSTTALFFPQAFDFWSILILSSIFGFFSFAILTLMDSNLLTLLGENRRDYGKYRLGGTFGFIVTTAGAGWLLAGRPFSAIFPIYSIIMVGFILTALTLPSVKTSVRRSTLSLRETSSLLHVQGWPLFLLAVFVIWTAGSGGTSFVTVTLRSMGAESGLIGIVAASAAVFEIPFMLFHRQFMDKLGSLRMFQISIAGYFMRLLGYSLIPAPVYGIFVNMFNGVSYVWMWNSSITYMHETAPDHLKATSQGVFNATTALAGLAGAPLAGWLFDTIGAQPMYKVLALIAVGAFVFFTLNKKHLLDPHTPKLASNP